MKKLAFLFKLGCFMFVFFIVAVVCLYTYAYFSPKIPIKSTNKVFIYDSNDELVYQGSGSSKWVSLEEISPYIIDAVISVEDKYFYNHNGFDFLRIAKALFINAKQGGIVQGASTISQQYIKNMYLDFSKKWSRKIEEALLTLSLEVHYEKDEILEGYLNTINFGNGNYGVEDASEYYFNKKSKDLSLEEAIILAGVPKSPENYNPKSNMNNALTRGKIVANALLNNKKISQNTYDKLFVNELEIYGKRQNSNSDTIMYYQDAVLNELYNLKEIPKSLIETGSLKIYTNFNLEIQTNLEASIKRNIIDDYTQIASIIVNPKGGEVIALVGGVDYAISQFNRATQAKRQVGSTMKPFLYYAALENGLTSSSTFISEPTSFVFANSQLYEPANFNHIYGNSPITMAAALAYSDNIYAVKTHLFLGEQVLVNTAKKLGITSKLKTNASLALGSSEISMIDFASGYNTLASGGYKYDLHFIKKVEDENGKILYEKKLKKNLVLNSNYVYILNELLTSTYNSDFIDYNKPTALSIASQINRKYSVKSGSTGADFWMVGYNPDLLMLVWSGLDDNKQVNTKYSSITKKIWAESVEFALKDTEPNWYSIPNNVVGLPLNPISGKYDKSEKSILFYYVKGTEPYINN